MSWNEIKPEDVFKRMKENELEYEAQKAKMASNSASLQRPAGDTDDFFEEYKKSLRLGHGGFGTVYQYEKVGPPTELRPKLIAVKEVKECNDEKRKKNFRRELEALKGCQHENIVRYLHYNLIENGFNEMMLNICMELCDTSLDKILGDLLERNRRLSYQQMKRLSQQILSGLHYLHETKGIVHRDLKPGNILIKYKNAADKNLNHAQAKISDFGLAKELNDGDAASNTVCGTPGFCAPEVDGRLKNVDPKPADIFSLGLTFWYMWTFKKCSPHKLISKGGQFLQDELDDDVKNADVREALKSMLKRDPAARQTTSELGRSFSLFQPEITLELYKIKRYLDQGSFGVTCIYTRKETNNLKLPEEVVIKFVSTKFEGDLQIWKNFSHKNVIKLHDFQLEAPHAVVIMDKCTTNLTAFMKSREGRTMLLNDVKSLWSQITDAMIYIHQKKIAHGNLKPDNVLLDNQESRLTARISDIFPSMPSHCINKQTLEYMSPEASKNFLTAGRSNFSKRKSDIFSVGLIFYFILKKGVPVPCIDGIIHQKDFNTFEAINIHEDHEMKVIKGLCQYDQNQRWDLNDVDKILSRPL